MSEYIIWREKLRFLFFSTSFFQYHLFVKRLHHSMQYHVVHVVLKVHVIMMHASENILFEKNHVFLPLAAIFSNNLHNLCKKVVSLITDVLVIIMLL